MKKILYVIIFLCIISACTGRREYREVLSNAQSVIEERPDSSLAILDALGRHSDAFDEHFRMQYLLELTYAKAKMGHLFDTDSLTKALVSHFDGNGTCREKALAYYMNGCALCDIGQTPEALQAFYDAIDKADTTRSDCDYGVLRGIYGQMSTIFHQQILPQDEIWALRHYIECVRRTLSEEDYIIAKGQMIRPYYLLGEKDTVLNIIEEKYKSLRRLGKDKEAVASFGTAIHIYKERGQIQKAQKMLDAFERESGLFDRNGNIVKGREGYYFTKGFFQLASNDINSAEENFRKAIQYGHLSDGYKGLLRVYRAKNIVDSVFRYSELYEAAQDSIHNRMQIDAIHQMAALYNYSRSQKEAEIEREKARTNRLWIIAIATMAVIVIGGVFLYYRDINKKKKQKISELERDLNMMRITRVEILGELQQMKSHDYEGVIASKEMQLLELTEAIERLQAENEKFKEGSAVREKDNLEQFLNSNIANLFIRKATGKTERVVPTEAEWKMLVSQFSNDNPATYNAFCSGKHLSKSEQRICILLILDIPENVISIMLSSTASSVSNLKARANDKLFGVKLAHPLKNNLIHALNSI